MKKISLLYKGIILILFIGILNGCNEGFLELSPKTTLTIDQFYKTEADFETAILGIYGNWATQTDREMMLTEFRADNLTNSQYLFQEFSIDQFGPNTTEIIWFFYQKFVHPANVIITEIEDAEIDEGVKNRIKGEALFFRGYGYYYLNLWFGGVPLVLQPLTIEESYQLGRSSESEIWELVQEDLDIAVSLLPPTANQLGRLNKYIAESFLAKAYMQQQKWGEAKMVLADVFQNSGAELEPVWTDMWSLEAEKTTKEFMWTSIWSPAAPNTDFGTQFLYIDGETQGNFEYEIGLYESFEEGDIRRDETLGFLNGKYENRKYDYGWDYAVKAFVADIVVLRFTDIQLLYAEAISMSAGSPQQESLNLINEVRNRAGLGDLTMSDVPTLNDFVEAVLAERRAEFVFEYQRYDDLKRHNKLVEKLNSIGYNFDESFNVIPIPQSEIDKMQGVLTQND